MFKKICLAQKSDHKAPKAIMPFDVGLPEGNESTGLSEGLWGNWGMYDLNTMLKLLKSKTVCFMQKKKKTSFLYPLG